MKMKQPKEKYVSLSTRDISQKTFLPVVSPFIQSTNKTCHHDLNEILLKMALNTIALTLALYTQCTTTSHS